MVFNTTKLKLFYKQYHVWLYGVTLFVIFIAFWLLSNLRLDPDFGWHLQSGRYILAHWIPRTDIYTYTAPNFAWINHEWLNDVIVAGLFRIGNYILVAGFFAAIWTLGLLLASRKKYLIPAVLAAVSLAPFLGIRPIAWGVLMFTILERILNAKNRKLVWLLPVLMLVWANLHGSFALGLVIIVCWQIFSQRKLPWLCIVLSLTATFINPYGWGIYVEIARTVFDSKLHTYIAEWKYILLPLASAFYVVVFVALHFSLSKKPFRQIFSIPGLLLLLSFSSIRHFPLFEASSLRYLENYEHALVTKVTKKKLSKSRLVIVFVLIGLFLCALGFFTWQQVKDTSESINTYPVTPVQYLNSHPCQGNLFNSYNYGGYLIWQLPSQKVYIDGRMPSWKDKGQYYMENYFDFYNKSSFRESEIKRQNITCILIKNGELTPKEKTNFTSDLFSHGWQQVNEASDVNSTLFVRNENGS